MFNRAYHPATALIGAILALQAIAGSTPTLAQCECGKLVAGDAAAEDFFGYSVSLSGDLIVIGAPFDDDGGTDSGSAYVFVREDSIWFEEAKLTASDAAPGDFFGMSVSTEGDLAVVGACMDDQEGANCGSVYIFRREGMSWVEEAKLTASDAAPGDNFGRFVCVSGDLVAVGAIGDDDAGSNSGSVYVFRRESMSWVEEAKLTASDAAAGDTFGTLCISADRLVAGAAYDDDGGTDSGSAYVFRREGTSWFEEAKLTASDAAPGDYFGAAVCVSGDRIVVGAEGNDDGGDTSGSAYIFRREATNWVEEAKLTASYPRAVAAFGISVSTSGERVVVGAFMDWGGRFHSGAAYLFEREGEDWVEEAKLTASDAATAQYFGGSVWIDGDRAAVGAFGDAYAGPGSGAAYVFELELPDCPGDLDRDCDTDQADLGVLLAEWGCIGADCRADLDGDDDTDQGDLGVLLADWGCGVP